MALPSTDPFAITGDPAVDVIATGYRWRLGADRTIAFTISDGFDGERWSDSGVDPGELAAGLGRLFANLSSYADVSFAYLGRHADPAAAARAGADINLAVAGIDSSFFSYSYEWAIGHFPTTRSEWMYAGQAGDIYFNSDSGFVSLGSYAPGSQGWFVLLHEVGHALGLKHLHDSGGTGRPTWSELNDAGRLGFRDVDWTSMMSYEDDRYFNFENFDPATPMLFDVIGLQYLYGKNMSTFAGDDAHMLTRTSLYETIWDAGGRDVVSAAGASEGWLIRLPDTAVSPLVGELFGYAEPLSGVQDASPTSFVWLEGAIEAAVGSAYADDIRGGPRAERLQGGMGDDSIDGGDGGGDVAVLLGARGQHVVRAGAASVTVSGPEGRDALTGIEQIDFLDGALHFAPGAVIAQVWRLYQGVLGREAEYAGLNGWTDAIERGMPIVEVAGSFAASAEFAARYGELDDRGYVQRLYVNSLGREPDAHGEAAWLRALAGGADRGAVAVGISNSAEAIRRTADVYVDGLWDVDENASYVSRLYLATLGRDADAGGLAHWTGELDAGAARATVAGKFADSFEFRTRYDGLSDPEFVGRIYLDALGRSADPGGFNHWGGVLAAGGGRETVLASIADSHEFQLATADRMDDGVDLI